MTDRPLPDPIPIDPGFDSAVQAFLANPSVAGWEHLILGLPPTRRHQAARETALRARVAGVDPTLLFHCLLRTGPSAELLALVESGSVEPTVVAAAADEAPQALRPLWWALAAQAAQARGEHSRAELLLYRALKEEPDHPGVRVVMARMARRLAFLERYVA